MISLSFGQKVALGIALPTAGLLIYLLWRSDDDDEEVDGQSFVTSRQTVIEVKVPHQAVGAVIGRQGCTIKEISQATGARIHFRDRESNNEEDRVVLIRGNAESAQDAELRILKIITEQKEIKTEEIHVPQKVLGRIIGRGGESIREIMRLSRCKINIAKNTGNQGPNTLTPIELKGTEEQISSAKSLIDEKVIEAAGDRNRDAAVMANRRERGRPRGNETDIKAVTRDHPEQVRMPDHSDYLEVYVTAMEHPVQFWVQILTASSARLDELVETMTLFYDDPNSIQYAKIIQFNKNDIVAAPFPYDNSWYRARIVECSDNSLDLFYVDYGDSGTVPKEKIRQLRSDFLCLPFQAVEVGLADIRPKDGRWSEEALDLFEEITAPGKWRTLMARTTSYRETEDGSIPLIDLVDTNGSEDVYIRKRLIDEGFAINTEPSKPIENGVPPGDGPSNEVESHTLELNTAER